MKFKTREPKYLQFGRETIKIEKDKVYDIEKDFKNRFIKPITYIVKRNSRVFDIVNEDTKKEEQEPKKEVNEVISSDLIEEPQETEQDQEEKSDDVFKKSDLDQMTKTELLELQERFNLDASSSDLKQEVYEQVENYLLEQDLLVD